MNRFFVFAMVLASVLPGLVTAQPADIAMANLSIDSSSKTVVDTVQNKPERLEAAMRKIYANVSIGDFDAIVRTSVDALVGLNKPAEARMVADVAARIKAPQEERGVDVDFRIHAEGSISPS